MASLIFTIAQNGYGHAWRPCVDSQKRYAKRLGINFVAIEKPRLVPEPAVSAWLKIPTMLNALKSGYTEVAYIDADCEVRGDAPDFREVFADSADDVLMAEGLSGRLNSGVMFARASDRSIAFFQAVQDSMIEPISDEDRANLKYENGNVIYVDRVQGGVGRLAPEWNNTYDENLDDHIRHYTGPLRESYRRSRRDAVLSRIGRIGAKSPARQPVQRDASFALLLESERLKTVDYYPGLMARGN